MDVNKGGGNKTKVFGKRVGGEKKHSFLQETVDFHRIGWIGGFDLTNLFP